MQNTAVPFAGEPLSSPATSSNAALQHLRHFPPKDQTLPSLSPPQSIANSTTAHAPEETRHCQSTVRHQFAANQHVPAARTWQKWSSMYSSRFEYGIPTLG